MPEGFAVDAHVFKLRKALEGIKQGANLWFKRNAAALTPVGFSASLTEPNLYVHQEHPIMVAVFVDDIIIGYDLRPICQGCILAHQTGIRQVNQDRGNRHY